MNKLGTIVGMFTVAMLVASVASAAPVTCPNPLTGNQDNTYTVDPATDCVWGNGNINGGTNDQFLDGNGTNDLAYGDSGPTFGFTDWEVVGKNSDPGDPITGITFTNLTGGFANWTLTDTNFLNYALGVKDGGDPKWAVFLLDGTSGTVSMTGGSFSHFILYGRGEGPGAGGPAGSSVPEPASLLLLGGGLAVAAATLRKRRSRV